MKLCDVNTHIGHWPFRQLPYQDVKTLLKQMDRVGIEKAAVCHTHSLFYKNAHRGNEELFQQTSRHRDRLFPVATLNPLYVGSRDDLRSCVEDFGMRALRLTPPYHDYQLSCPQAVEFAQAAGELGLAVFVPFRIVDVRQRHWLDTETNISLAQLADFARATGKLTIVATEFPLTSDRPTVRLLKKVSNITLGISRIRNVVPEALSELITELGKERFLFDSGMPFKAVQCALLRLAALKKAADREFVGRKNFETLFGS